MKKIITLMFMVLALMGCQNPVDNSTNLSGQVVGMWEWLPNESADYGETEFKEDLSMSRKINSVEYDFGTWKITSENNKTLVFTWNSGFIDSVTLSTDNLSMIKNNNGVNIILATKQK